MLQMNHHDSKLCALNKQRVSPAPLFYKYTTFAGIWSASSYTAIGSKARWISRIQRQVGQQQMLFQKWWNSLAWSKITQNGCAKEDHLEQSWKWFISNEWRQSCFTLSDRSFYNCVVYTALFWQQLPRSPIVTHRCPPEICPGPLCPQNLPCFRLYVAILAA